MLQDPPLTEQLQSEALESVTQPLRPARSDLGIPCVSCKLDLLPSRCAVRVRRDR